MSLGRTLAVCAVLLVHLDFQNAFRMRFSEFGFHILDRGWFDFPWENRNMDGTAGSAIHSVSTNALLHVCIAPLPDFLDVSIEFGHDYL